MGEIMDYVMKSKIKDLVRENEAMMGGDFLEALDQKVKALVEEAIKRAKGNNRKTVRAIDL